MMNDIESLDAQVTVRLTQDYMAQLDRLAAATGIKRGQLARNILSEFLDRKDHIDSKLEALLSGQSLLLHSMQINFSATMATCPAEHWRKPEADLVRKDAKQIFDNAISNFRSIGD